MYPTRSELTAELCELFEKSGYTIYGAIDCPALPPPELLTNGRFGHLQDVQPDVEAFDSKTQRAIYGIVCANKKEIDSEATLTTWNVCLNQVKRKNEQQPLVVTIVPASEIGELTSVLTHALHPEYWESIRLVPSGRF